jgi:chitin disaccharide deacetylase
VQLIVNADDLGYSPAVNREIFEWIGRGCVSSATLMANAPCVEEAAARLGDYPRCSFGVHLNVEELAPLRPDPALAPLLDDTGSFARKLRSARLTPAVLRAVFAEWCAQVDRLRQLGVQPTHFDSHHHAHNVPRMLPVLAALRRRYGIPCARITMNVFEAAQRRSLRVRAAKRLYNLALRHACGFRTSDGFAFLRTAFEVEPGELARYPTLELMSHPGHPRYEDETQLLGRLADRLPGRTLIGYRELARA